MRQTPAVIPTLRGFGALRWEIVIDGHMFAPLRSRCTRAAVFKSVVLVAALFVLRTHAGEDACVPVRWRDRESRSWERSRVKYAPASLTSRPKSHQIPDERNRERGETSIPKGV